MNRLQIAQAVNIAAGTQGTLSTTVGLVGEQQVLVQMVDQAYEQIQLFRNNWNFMKRTESMSFTSALSTHSNVDIAKVEMLIYNYSQLKEIPYREWLLAERQTTKPSEWTKSLASGASIIVNPLDDSYLVDLYYWAVPDAMTLNSSVPVLPVQYHRLIVYKALMGLGAYLANYDIINENALLHDTMMGQMMRTECPSLRVQTPPFVI